VSGNPVDVMLFILGPDDALVAFTEQRGDAKGVSTEESVDIKNTLVIKNNNNNFDSCF